MIPLAILLGPEHSDVITTGGQLLIAIVSVVGAIEVALIQSGRKAAKNAAAAAQSVAEQNVGDHAHVLEVLEEVQAELIAQRRTAERHARQSEERHRENRRDIGGLREEMRTERSERHQLAEYVIDNLPRKDTP